MDRVQKLFAVDEIVTLAAPLLSMICWNPALQPAAGAQVIVPMTNKHARDTPMAAIIRFTLEI